MSDELDPLLLRAFAQGERPFPDAEFVARVSAQLRPRASLRATAQTLASALEVALGGLATGLAAFLRLRYLGLAALAAAVVAVLTLLPAV